MSEGMIIRRGGGASLKATDALLRVQAPAGSTVTISKGTTTKTDLGHENADDHTLYDYYFIIHQSQFDSVNPWTVTATLGSNTATSTVVVDSADEYDVVLSYHVPSGYQEVEYITFPQGAYINTGISASPSRAAEFKVSGARAEDHYLGTSDFTASVYHISHSSGKYYWAAGNNEASGGTWVSGAKVISYNNAQNNYIPQVDGINIVNSSNAANTSGLNILIGKRGNGNFQGDFYYLILRNNSDSSLAFEGYPCYRKSDSVVGFWDKVSETFLTNAGSGTLIAGPNVN